MLPGSKVLPAEEDQQSALGDQQQDVPDLAFYAFPTLEQLSKATEAALRAEGFGYRSGQDFMPPQN